MVSGTILSSIFRVSALQFGTADTGTQKNEISHRGKALRAMRKLLGDQLVKMWQD